MADGHEIPVNDAAAMTAAWRNSGSFETFSGRKALAFNSDAIARLMNQDGCSGLRCYLAIDEAGEITLVLAGYDEEGNDLLNELADRGTPCPSFCSEKNSLNS